MSFEIKELNNNYLKDTGTSIRISLEIICTEKISKKLLLRAGEVYGKMINVN